MFQYHLPDGKILTFPQAVNGLTLAENISKSLARSAYVIMVNNELWDLSRALPDGAKVRIITRDNDEALPVLRHDCAHVMAQAVQELYPRTQITFGPATDDGFYYDFARTESFTPEDFPKIEQRMHEIIARAEPFTRQIWNRQQAKEFFHNKGELFKAEHVDNIPPQEPLTIYQQGDWLDLCRGPHGPNTGAVGKGFKLTKLSGSYWRGDANNQPLQRIYGVCFRNTKELEQYLTQQAEAEKRDHRKLGRQLQLFHFQDEAAGSVFWHVKGYQLWQVIEQYIRQKQLAYGYQEIKTPQLVNRKLWEDSGHWEKFRQHMFLAEVDENEKTNAIAASIDPNAPPLHSTKTIMALKPMNCPCHVQVFKQGIKSYRELPLRLAEFGACHRYEPSGALHGLMRVRAFTQDDAHIFCQERDIVAECKLFGEMLLSVYQDFGFNQIAVKFSDRPITRAGTDAIWDKAEQALLTALKATGLDYTINKGEGAFYGPKLEYVLKDSLGREWQCGTFQVDFVLPERLEAHYIDEQGQKQRPVMLHRAVLGSFERFIGILLEHYAGRLPFWLAPVQIMVTTITSDSNAYALKVAADFKKAGLRVEHDLRNEKINAKIRDHSLQYIPVIAVVGKKEAETNQVALRFLGRDHNQTNNLELNLAIKELLSLNQPKTHP